MKYIYDEGFSHPKLKEDKKLHYNYLTDKDFTKYKKKNNSKLVGYTSFNECKLDDEDVKVLTVKDTNYWITDNVPFEVNKYIPVGHNKFVGVKSEKSWLLIPFAIFIILLPFLFIGSYLLYEDNQKRIIENMTEEESLANIDHNYVYIPIIESKLELSSGNTSITLSNPKENDNVYELQYILTCNDSILAETKWIKSDTEQKVNLYELLNRQAGEYKVEITTNKRKTDTKEEDNSSDTSLGTTVNVTIK